MTRYFIVILLILGLLVNTALADSEGPNSPSSVSDQGDWVNSGDIFTSNNVRASFNATSQYILRAYTFGFSVSGTIDGIVVEVEGYGTEPNTTHRIIDVALAKSGYTPEGDWALDTLAWTASNEAYQTFGGAADLWNGSWSDTDINSSDFSVLIRDHDALAYTIYIDHVRVTVYFTASGFSQTVTVIDTNLTDLSFEIDPVNYSSLDSIIMLLDSSNPPTTHVDSVMSTPTDPDTLGSGSTPLSEYTWYWFRAITYYDGSLADTSVIDSVQTLSSDTTPPDNYASFEITMLNSINPDSITIAVGSVDSVDFDTTEWRYSDVSYATLSGQTSGTRLMATSGFESSDTTLILSVTEPTWVYVKGFTGDEVDNWSSGVGDSIYIPEAGSAASTKDRVKLIISRGVILR